MELTGSILDAIALLEYIGVDVVVEQKAGKPGRPAHYLVRIEQESEVLSSGKASTPRRAMLRALLVGFGVSDEDAIARTNSLPSEEVMASSPDLKAVLDAEGLRTLLLAAAMAINADATIADIDELVGGDDEDGEGTEENGESEG